MGIGNTMNCCCKGITNFNFIAKILRFYKNLFHPVNVDKVTDRFCEFHTTHLETLGPTMKFSLPTDVFLACLGCMNNCKGLCANDMMLIVMPL